jgi:peptide deformylase
MAERRILRMGNPVLRRRALEVADPTSEDLKALVVDMIDSMTAADGVGLAAPQIGVGQRVVVFFTPPEGPDQGPDQGSPGMPDDPAREMIREQPLTVLVNPEIEIIDDQLELGVEGCLSVPGMCGPVPRHACIRYTGDTPEGGRIDRTVDGFHARVVQHECDHLDGILYPMRMEDIGLLAYVDEVKRLQEEGAEAAEAEEAEEMETGADPEDAPA